MLVCNYHFSISNGESLRVLQSGKVARNGRRSAGRISLSPDAMQEMGIQLGDFIMIVEDEGQFYVKKVNPDV